MNKVIDGKQISLKIKEELKNKLEKEKITPHLVVLQVGNNPASDVYVKNKKNLCEQIGIKFTHKKYETVTEKELINEIELLNNDNTVDGILVQLPLPKEINENKVVETINPKKDVDGLTTKNIGNLFSNNEGLIPCTALGIMKIFEEEQINLEGKNITIVGRSKLVGLPLLGLLINKNATVTLCHSKTQNLKEKTKNADILIVAIGKKEYIKDDYIKEDAIVIDVGINRENNKLYGDCDYKNIYDKCKRITPVPGGVGPLTVAMLGYNVIKAYKINKK